MPRAVPSGETLWQTLHGSVLDAAYFELGYEGPDLLDAAAHPNDATSQEWISKGDWLALAKKVGVERVFFVNDYPLIVFAEQPTNEPSEWMRCFNSIWCMARPQILFLARQGEMSVFDLTRRPAREGERPEDSSRLLKAVQTTTEVQTTLASYRCDQIESGRLFAGKRFGSEDRADRALIRDLGRVRQIMIDDGVSPGHAHALIGRSIFIRYLEDRGVLTEKYFR